MTPQTSSCSFAWEEEMRSAGLVTLSSTKGRLLWWVKIVQTASERQQSPNRSSSQLDAGQHPAYDGLAALPFFDDFDLSTGDVLLIIQ